MRRNGEDEMARAPVFAWQDALLRLDLRDAPMRRSTVIGVGFVLSFHFNRGLIAWPSAETLAREAGTKPGTVRRVTALLERTGLLLVERRGRGAGAGNTNRYRGLVPGSANRPSEDRSPHDETGPHRPDSYDGNGVLQATKRSPAGDETAPSGTPNSKEQHKNSTAHSNKSLTSLKQEHPDQWEEALSETDRRIDAGKDIPYPDRYANPIFLEILEKHREKARLRGTADAAQAAIDACNLCNIDGRVAWETEGGRPAGDRCSHRAADYEGLDIITRQKQEGRLYKK
jgi:hypothetical protein